MNKITLITILLTLVAMAGQAQTFTHSKDVGMGACIKKK